MCIRDRYSADLFRALARAVMLGIPVVGGLTNDPLSTTGAFPAEANGSVAVQAIDVTCLLYTSRCV